jgi:uncharacterized protein
MYLFRSNESFIFQSLERPLVSALLGPRRVGKTTLVNHYIKLHPDRKWIVFNMDDRPQRLRIANNELHLMIEEKALQRVGAAEKIWVVIDEAQKCPELFEQVKIIYDTFKDQNAIKFILTGSAHLDLHELSAESLAGRVDLLNLREFNLREITSFYHKQKNITETTAFDLLLDSSSLPSLENLFLELRPFNKIFKDSLEQQIVFGGLPEVLQEENNDYRWRYLANYLQTYLEKDVRAIATIGDLTLYQQLMQLCAEQTGSLRDDKKITDALHSSRNTINKYRSYLAATLQYVDIYPYIGNALKRLTKSPKGYIINNGLVSYLTGLNNLPILKTTGQIGHRFENWFLNELQVWLDKSVEHRRINYWRTTSGVEVDFIVTLGHRVIPIEITYSTQIQKDKLRHLQIFLSGEPKAQFGIYLYMGDFLYDKNLRIYFLPAWMV